MAGTEKELKNKNTATQFLNFDIFDLEKCFSKDSSLDYGDLAIIRYFIQFAPKSYYIEENDRRYYWATRNAILNHLGGFRWSNQSLTRKLNKLESEGYIKIKRTLECSVDEKLILAGNEGRLYGKRNYYYLTSQVSHILKNKAYYDDTAGDNIVSIFEYEMYIWEKLEKQIYSDKKRLTLAGYLGAIYGEWFNEKHEIDEGFYTCRNKDYFKDYNNNIYFNKKIYADM